MLQMGSEKAQYLAVGLRMLSWQQLVPAVLPEARLPRSQPPLKTTIKPQDQASSQVQKSQRNLDAS